MELVPYRAEDAGEIVGWATSDAEARAWCGRPRPDASVLAEWHRDPDVEPYVLLHRGTPVAYGEIWTEDAECELARLIVRPSARGRGVGRALVAELLGRARRNEVFVRVLPDNAPALACYRRAGFVRVPGGDEDRFNRGQPRAYVWMRRPGDGAG